MSENSYRGLIFTTHALLRMKERGITRDEIWETFNSPDFQDEKKNDATERRKKFGKKEVSIIFKHNRDNETIIVSCWMEPPLPGSRDAREKEWWEKYKKAGFFGKIWLTFLKQITS